MLGVLAQYGTVNPWASFVADAEKTYADGVTVHLTDEPLFRDAAQKRWRDLYSSALARISTRIRKIEGVSDPLVREPLKAEAEELRNQLYSYDVFINMITSKYVTGTQFMFFNVEEYNVTQSQLKSKFNAFEELLTEINSMAYRMETLEINVPLLQKSAQELAQAAMASITPERLAEIRQKAGSSETYYATLYNQLYLEALAQQYEKELGSDIMSAVRQQIKVNNDFIEAAKPTIATSALESEVVDKAITVGEQIKREGIVAALIPDFVKKGAMWSTVIGVGMAAGGVMLISKIISGIRNR